MRHCLAVVGITVYFCGMILDDGPVGLLAVIAGASMAVVAWMLYMRHGDKKSQERCERLLRRLEERM